MIRNKSWVLILGLCLSGFESTFAATFTLDGIYDPASDAYTHQYSFPLILDDGTPAGQTDLKVGIGSNIDGQTGGPNDLFLYFEMPLNLKDMTWGNGTHDGYSESSNDVLNGIIAMNQNTGSEKIKFQWNGQDVEVKLSQRGNGSGGKSADLQPCSDAGTCVGHELSKDGSGAVIGAATSLDYIMNNFPNQLGQLNLWGDANNSAGANVSNSPTLKQASGMDIYETVDPALADWPFHQSWEIQISGNFVPADLPNLLADSNFFGADFGGNDPSNSNFLLHASPIKDGAKFDIVPNCLPGDCLFLPIIPEPSTLMLVGCLLVGLCGKRRFS